MKNPIAWSYILYGSENLHKEKENIEQSSGLPNEMTFSDLNPNSNNDHVLYYGQERWLVGNFMPTQYPGNG